MVWHDLGLGPAASFFRKTRCGLSPKSLIRGVHFSKEVNSIQEQLGKKQLMEMEYGD